MLAALASSPVTLRAQEPDKPDNTRANREDRKAGEPTADQAKNNPSDRDLMQKIRKDIVGDKSLSTYAHNIKVIAANGKVTLKGPVRSNEERASVEAKAVAAAGAENVINQLTVKEDTSSDKPKK